jgi:hypothetical protein
MPRVVVAQIIFSHWIDMAVYRTQDLKGFIKASSSKPKQMKVPNEWQTNGQE